MYYNFPRQQLCQPKENPVLSDSFTQIYILFLIGFRIGLPKMQRRVHISLPKIHKRFRIGVLKCIDGSVLAHLRFPSTFSNKNYSWGILLTIAIMKEKQHNNLFEIGWKLLYSEKKKWDKVFYIDIGKELTHWGFFFGKKTFYLVLMSWLIWVSNIKGLIFCMYMCTSV